MTLSLAPVPPSANGSLAGLSAQSQLASPMWDSIQYRLGPAPGVECRAARPGTRWHRFLRSLGQRQVLCFRGERKGQQADQEHAAQGGPAERIGSGVSHEHPTGQQSQGHRPTSSHQPADVVTKRGGEMVAHVFRLVLAQIRSKHETAGDFRAQVAANASGSRRLLALLDRQGAETVTTYLHELLAYTERRTRAAVARLPLGVFSAEGTLDNDGFTDQPVRLTARVVIDEQGVLFDLTGCGPQRRAPVNSTYAQTFSACAYVLKCLIDPDIPVNAGFYRLVRVVAPTGTVVSCTPPAPVVDGWETQTRLTDVILKALAPALPEGVPAGTKAMMCHAGFGGIDPDDWKEALKGWNMQESPFVLELQAEAALKAELRATLKALKVVLEGRFGVLSADLLRRIEAIPGERRQARLHGGVGTSRRGRMVGAASSRSPTSAEAMPAGNRPVRLGSPDLRNLQDGERIAHFT